jgi:hypothetical protein
LPAHINLGKVRASLDQEIRINIAAPEKEIELSRFVVKFAESCLHCFVGSVAKNILATFHSGDELAHATASCVDSEFLQQIHQRQQLGRQCLHLKTSLGKSGLQLRLSAVLISKIKTGQSRAK